MILPRLGHRQNLIKIGVLLKMRREIVQRLFDALLIDQPAFFARLETAQERVAERIAGKEAVQIAAQDAAIG